MVAYWKNIVFNKKIGEDGGYRVGAAYDSVGDSDDVEAAVETRCGSVQDVQSQGQTRYL